jgi:hypothetical protein
MHHTYNLVKCNVPQVPQTMKAGTPAAQVMTKVRLILLS